MIFLKKNIRLGLCLFLMLWTVLAVKAQSTAPDIVCAGTQKNYSVNPTAGSSYIWKINNGTALSNTTNSVDITWDTPGDYTLSVQEITHDVCVGPLITLDVTVKYTPSVTLSSVDVCAGENLTFSATPVLGAVYDWTLNGQLITGHTSNTYVITSATNALSATYNMSVVATYDGCSSIPATASPMVKSLPVVTCTPTTNNVCPGENIVFTATNGYQAYAWTINGTVDATQTGNTYIYPTTTGGTVSVAVIATNNGCASNTAGSTTGTIKTAPPTPLVNPYAHCSTTGDLNLTSLVLNSVGTQKWYDSPIATTALTQTVISKENPISATYYVSLQSANLCESGRVPVPISVYELPVISNIDKTDVKNVIIDVANGVAPYYYTVNGTVSPVFAMSATVTEFVAGNNLLLVTDNNGCKDQEIVNIPITHPKPREYFSPNNDGENDTWFIQDIDLYPKAEIIIYDRFGKELARYTGLTYTGWDGTYQGYPMPSDDYWYVINVPETASRFVGHFNLRR